MFVLVVILSGRMVRFVAAIWSFLRQSAELTLTSEGSSKGGGVKVKVQSVKEVR